MYEFESVFENARPFVDGKPVQSLRDLCEGDLARLEWRERRPADALEGPSCVVIDYQD